MGTVSDDLGRPGRLRQGSGFDQQVEALLFDDRADGHESWRRLGTPGCDANGPYAVGYGHDLPRRDPVAREEESA